jgi:sodium-dependent dicarboxylate transporter 2/3/5
MLKPLKLFGLAAALAILVGTQFVPARDSLPPAAGNTLGLLIAVIVLLVTEVFPIGATCLVTIALMVLFKCVPDISAALVGYTNPVLFFVLASFGISEALTVLPLSKRMLKFFMRIFGKNTRRLLFAIMLCAAALSSLISNVAATAVFIPIIMKFLDVYETDAEKAATARCYMIALPIAGMIGGMITPAGSSINMMTIGLLAKDTGINIAFVHWMFFGIPLAAVLLPVAWFLCSKVFKPAPLGGEKIRSYLETVAIDPKLSAKEIYVLAVLACLLCLWILSSWYPVFNVTAVALIGLLLFFVPGFEILTWKHFRDCVAWEAFFLIGTMISMGNAISSCGLGAWLAAVIFPASFRFPIVVVVGFVALLTFLLLIPIPVAPALVAMFMPPLIGFANNIGVSPYLPAMALGLCAGNCYFLPLDTVPLMTYATGSYKMFDLPRVSVALQLVIILLVAVWLPVAGRILGIV